MNAQIRPASPLFRAFVQVKVALEKPYNASDETKFHIIGQAVMPIIPPFLCIRCALCFHLPTVAFSLVLDWYSAPNSGFLSGAGLVLSSQQWLSQWCWTGTQLPTVAFSAVLVWASPPDGGSLNTAGLGLSFFPSLYNPMRRW
jgi:hypothetical protein